MWFFRSYWQNSQRFLLESERPINRSGGCFKTMKFKFRNFLTCILGNDMLDKVNIRQQQKTIHFTKKNTPDPLLFLIQCSIKRRYMGWGFFFCHKKIEVFKSKTKRIIQNWLFYFSIVYDLRFRVYLFENIFERLVKK